MQKKYTIILSPLILFIIYITQSSYSGGITGSSTGCSCHGGSSGNTSVTLTGLPPGGYTNGTVYALTISVTNNVITPFTGSGATGLRDGFTLSETGGTVSTFSGSGMAVNGSSEIRHITPKVPIAGTASWTFNWTAPVSGSATVNFTMAGNATNGNNNSNGDQWNFYQTSVAKAISPVFVGANASPILCNGNLSTITATGSGGSGLLQYRLNSGIYQSSGTFANNAAGTYTITVKDAVNTTASTTINITQPSLLANNTLSINHPICNGGLGNISISTIGGVGTKTYSITPSGPQTNTTGTFTNLAAQAYTVTTVDINNCSLATTLTVTQPSPPLVNSFSVSGCEAHPIGLLGTPAGGSFSVSNPYTGPSTTYTYTYTDGNGCVGTSSPSNITVQPIGPNAIIQSISGGSCETISASGYTKFSNNSCELLLGANISGLGTVTSCVQFLPGSPSWNGEPYANRVYSINSSLPPTSPVNLCLYYTNSELLAVGITNPSDISITKVDGNGILGGPGQVTEILNSNMTINQLIGGVTEVCFSVNSFSTFYLHSKNPNNVPLPVSLTNFKGEAGTWSDKISWETLAEKNHAAFHIQHSKDGVHFIEIAKVASKSNNGESNAPLLYSFENKNIHSIKNYYRLELLDLFGNTNYSETITLNRHSEHEGVLVSPNPSKGTFLFEASKPMHISVYDLTGAILFEKKNTQNTIIEIKKAGIYLLRATSSSGQQETQRLVVYE